jgi:hypothetical protein
MLEYRVHTESHLIRTEPKIYRHRSNIHAMTKANLALEMVMAMHSECAKYR